MILTAVLGGLSCLFVVATFIPQLSGARELSEEMTQKFIPQKGSTVLALLAVAIIPAIAEELAFRGIILNGLLRGFPKSWAIVLSSVMFAVMHMSTIRFLPTFCIGLLLAYTAIQTRSIFPGMIIHALNNGVAVLLVKFENYLDADESHILLPPLALAGLAIAIAAFYFNRRQTVPPIRSEEPETLKVAA